MTTHSKRKMNRFNPDRMQVKVSDVKSNFQVVSSMDDLMLDVEGKPKIIVLPSTPA
jgi:hypothetical protein